MTDVRTAETVVAREIATKIAADLRAHPENWIQGYFGSGLSAHCLVGHIIARTPEYLPTQNETSVYDAFAKVLGLGRDDCLSLWNDAPERTVEDVIAVCDKVAAS